MSGWRASTYFCGNGNWSVWDVGVLYLSFHEGLVTRPIRNDPVTSPQVKGSDGSTGFRLLENHPRLLYTDFSVRELTTFNLRLKVHPLTLRVVPDFTLWVPSRLSWFPPSPRCHTLCRTCVVGPLLRTRPGSPGNIRPFRRPIWRRHNK